MKTETVNIEFLATHKTKHGFGGLLPAGRKVAIFKEIDQSRVLVIDDFGNIWQGRKNDLETIF